MSVFSIFGVKKILRAYRLRECTELVEAALQLSTPEEIEDLVRGSLKKKFPEEFGENFSSKMSGN
jgi:phosphoenolpyruvate-protein kinase (PTS system EI component)